MLCQTKCQILIFNYSLRVGQMGLDIDVPLRISVCAVVADYGFSLTAEIEAHGLLICPEASLPIAKSR